MITLFFVAMGFIVFFLLFGCVFCKMFTNEWEHGEFEGGFKYVADQEHDGQGGKLTGWRLEFSRRAEQLFNPLCYWPNRLLGRTTADGHEKQ